MRRRYFYYNIRMTAFSLFCFTSFILLGFWQLDREKQKLVLIADRDAKKAGSVVEIGDLETNVVAEDSLPVKMSGTYLENFTLLLDNIVLNGQVGFEVVQLFRDKSDNHVMVNRGFVPMGRTREDPVNIPTVGLDHLEVLGRIYLPESTPIVLSSEKVDIDSFPAIVQRADAEILSNRLGKKIYPHIIRLNEGQQGALPRYWPDTVMPPEKHRGYAIQWFMMALAIVIAWLFLSFPIKEER